MRDKPFINLMQYKVRRHKYNPMRFILGEWYLTSSIQKWVNQQNLDTKDISFTTNCDKCLEDNGGFEPPYSCKGHGSSH